VRRRQRSKSVGQRDRQLLQEIEPIKAEHPSWGYRNVWSYLRYRQGLVVGKNRVYRLLKEHRLLRIDTRKLRATRVPTTVKPRTDRPNELWGIDMTKIMVESWGWLYLVVVKDWGSKKIVGWDLSLTSKTEDWLRALNQAVNFQFPEGIREHGKLMLVSDNGCQPTSEAFMKSSSILGIKQVFTSYNNPKGNADTERVIRTLKEDLIWPREWFSFQQLRNALEKWFRDYNEDFPRSAIGYLTPCQYEAKYNQQKQQQETSATFA